MSAAGWTWLAFAAHLVARAAYVGFVWVALQAQQRRGSWTRRWGVEDGFQRFRRVTSMLMAIDGATFIAVCLVGRSTLPPFLPRGVAIGAGVLLVIAGITTKLWAAATLGKQAYYWYNFFTPTRRIERAASGPYVLLENPMYTVGYFQAYGFALVTGSALGLVASLVDQAAILAFHRLVEKVHFDNATRRAA
jgi:protein-S-isoprenylcysteine O-methyltransferase Ste14